MGLRRTIIYLNISVKFEAPKKSCAFQEVYISAESPLGDVEEKRRLVGHFKNAWPEESTFSVRHNFFCGTMNRDFQENRAVADLFVICRKYPREFSINIELNLWTNFLTEPNQPFSRRQGNTNYVRACNLEKL